MHSRPRRPLTLLLAGVGLSVGACAVVMVSLLALSSIVGLFSSDYDQGDAQRTLREEQQARYGPAATVTAAACPQRPAKGSTVECTMRAADRTIVCRAQTVDPGDQPNGFHCYDDRTPVDLVALEQSVAVSEPPGATAECRFAGPAGLLAVEGDAFSCDVRKGGIRTRIVHFGIGPTGLYLDHVEYCGHLARVTPRGACAPRTPA